MATSPNKLQTKPEPAKPAAGRHSWAIWTAGAVVVLLAATYFLARPEPRRADRSSESATPYKVSLGRLYDEAAQDLKEKKFAAAASKFRQVANINPRYKDADRKAEVAIEGLYNEALQDLEEGNKEDAKDKLEQIVANDPTNQEAQDKLDEINDDTGGNTDDGDTGDTDADAGGPGDNPGPDDNDPPVDQAKSIPADATPLSLLMEAVDGYETIQRGWEREPVRAVAVYLPSSREMQTEIDRVILTIAKLEDGQEAESKLTQEKDAFPMESADVSINSHEAYSGLYNFEGASDFFKARQMASLAWTRDNWFFSIQVLPKGTPAAEYKKGITTDIAVKLGY